MSSLISLLAGTRKDPLIVICGEPHTGKSHLLQVWEEDAPPAQPSPIPLSLSVPAPTPQDPNSEARFEEISEVRSYLRLDVINQRMRARNEELLKTADMCLVLVDVNRKGSLDAVLTRWIDEEIRPRNPKVPIALVLTHTDGNLSQISLSMEHHVQPLALTIPAVRIFTVPCPTSRSQIEPIFEYAVFCALNPKQAFLDAEAARRSSGGSVEVVHLGPAGSACGMFLLGQVKGLAELRSNARACNERMEDVVRRIVKIVGKEGLEEVGAGELLPSGVAGDIILGNVVGAASGSIEAQDEIRTRCGAEGITVDELASRVVRSVGRDGADRLGVSHLLTNPMPMTPKMDRTLGIKVRRSDSRSSGRRSYPSDSPRPPSSLGKAMATPTWHGEYDEAHETPRRRSNDSGDRTADHGEEEAWTERSDETVGSHPGSSAPQTDREEREDSFTTPKGKLVFPAAVPVSLPSDRPPIGATESGLHSHSSSYDSQPRRISTASQRTPKASQKGYDKGAFVDRLNQLALDDALDGSSSGEK